MVLAVAALVALLEDHAVGIWGDLAGALGQRAYMRLYWPVVGEGILVGRECQEEEPSPTLGNSSSEAGSSPSSRWFLLSFPSFWTRLNCETQALVLRSAP